MLRAGTLRDIVLGGEQQVFWMRDVTYLKICIVTSLVTFFTWPRFETKRGWRCGLSVLLELQRDAAAAMASSRDRIAAA